MPEKSENRIADLIRKHDSFLVCSHMNPDGDAVGSCIALALFLEGEGKEVFIHNQSQIPAVYRFVPGVDQICQSIPTKKQFEVTFLLDCSKPSRVGEMLDNFRGKGEVVVIDHHPPTGSVEGVHLVRPGASSTGELLYGVFRAYGGEMRPEIATALYLAIITDTGSFQFSNTSYAVHHTVGDLLDAGADHRLVIEQLYENYPPERFILLEKVLQTLRFLCGGRLATLQLSMSIYDALNDDSEDLAEGFVNIPRSIRGVEVALFFKELGFEEYRVSLRSRGSVDVGELASNFDGGGHPNAAGCTVRGEAEKVYRMVTKAVQEALE